jgi:hypothetical protein
VESLLVPEGNATLAQVVGAHSHRDAVTKDHANAETTESSSQVRLYGVALLGLYREGSARVDQANYAFHVD